MYGADVSPPLISKVTDAVIEEFIEWQNRPLNSVYSVVYLDCIAVKVMQNKRVINKAIYQALGIHTDGQKELMGMWISDNIGFKFCLSVFVRYIFQGIPDHMDYAKLNDCLGINRVDCLRKACQTVNTGNEDSLNSYVLKL